MEGEIKTQPEDFVVEEILQDETILAIDAAIQRDGSIGDFTRFVLQKKNWTTEGAIRRIAQALGANSKRFSCAGSKDKISISTQLVSAFRINKNRISRLTLPDMVILGVWTSDKKVKIGELLGNRFTVIVRGTRQNAEQTVAKIHDELDGMFPNYYGEQRFGSIRQNTHKIGEYIIRGRYDLAATSFLCDHEGEIENDSLAARRNLMETGDFKKALEEFPNRLYLERIMIEHLEKHPRDYANAFRKLPRGVLLLFVHAFQSYLFNLMLSERIADGEVIVEDGEYYCEERLGFPDLKLKTILRTRWIAGKIIGYETELNDREEKLLERFELKTSDFEIKGIPELSTKGTRRLLLSPLKDFSFNDSTFRFSLPAGSYATVALREFLDRDKQPSLGQNYQQ